MAAVRHAAWLVARALVVFVAPLACVVVLAIVLGNTPSLLSEKSELVFEVMLSFGVASGMYILLRKTFDWPPKVNWVPFLYAAVLLAGVGAAQKTYELVRPDHSTPLAEQLAALDVLFIQPPSVSTAAEAVGALPEATADLLSRDVRFSVATPTSTTFNELRVKLVGGDGVAALTALVGGKVVHAPEDDVLHGSLLTWAGWRPRATRAVVLNVDGLDPRAPDRDPPDTGTLPRDWNALFGNPNLTAPVYAILGRATNLRLRMWRSWAARRGGDAMRFGEIGSKNFVEAAVRVVAERRNAFTKELAWKYRPKLFFDSGEQLRNTVDVERLLTSGEIRLCTKRGRLSLRNWRCRVITSLDQLGTKPGYMTIGRRAQRRALRKPGTIYYHSVWHGADQLHLDYWWYFPYNPTAVGFHGACRAGLGAANATCFDHVSDWEGLTVVLRRDGRDFTPTHVIYGQHEYGVAHRWDELLDRWVRNGTADGARPIVYVARDSHASYPSECWTRCGQLTGRIRREGHHDGGAAWARNSDAACAGECLKPLPATPDGRAASWNASPVHWGDQACIAAGAICNRVAAPQAPRFQGRFLRPWIPLRGTKKALRNGELVEFNVTYAKYDG